MQTKHAHIVSICAWDMGILPCLHISYQFFASFTPMFLRCRFGVAESVRRSTRDILENDSPQIRMASALRLWHIRMNRRFGVRFILGRARRAPYEDALLRAAGKHGRIGREKNKRGKCEGKKGAQREQVRGRNRESVRETNQ